MLGFKAGIWRQWRGDTIVEVTIAIGLLSATLLSAYTLANLAAQQGLAAREQDQATQVLQYQAEGIRYIRDQADDWDDFYNATGGGEFHVRTDGSGEEWIMDDGRIDGDELIGNLYQRYETWAEVVSSAAVEDKRDIVIYVEWEDVWGETQTTSVDTVLANLDPIPPPDDLPGAPDTGPAPDSPGGLTATAVSSSAIQLDWSSVSDPSADNYEVERDGTILGATPTLSSYTDTGLTEETTYAYRVRAVNDGGSSGWSNFASATTLPQSIFEEFSNISTGRSGSVQSWTVPETGSYTIMAQGAQGGGTYGGLGAQIVGDVTLNEGDQLEILIGQRGYPSSGYIGGGDNNASGGGGTFVVLNGNPLVVAGGGGAAYGGSAQQNSAAGRTVSSGGSGVGGNEASCAGGYGGNGGVGTCFTGSRTQNNAGFEGGAGFSGNGSGSARSFTSGGQGGSSNADGGYGGGGEANNRGGWSRLSGGGGYSGGGASLDSSWLNNHAAGGGGSYNSGINQSNSAGLNSGHGSVTIESAW